MDSTDTRKPTFLWRGILILLPVLLLATVGLYSLEQDRALAEAQARRDCQALARFYAKDISEQIVPIMESRTSTQLLSERMLLDEQDNLVRLDSSQSRAQIPREPIPRPFPETNLTDPQLNVWHDARRIDYVDNDESKGITLWRKFLELSPPAPFLDQARYDLGLLLVKHKDTNAADKLFAEVQDDHEAKTENGLPLSPLAELQRLQINHTRPSSIFYMILLGQPSFATPAIFDQVAKMQPPPHPDEQLWFDQWNKDQASRDFYLHVRPELAANRTRPRAFWNRWDGKNWLVVLKPLEKSWAVLLPFDTNVIAESVRPLTDGRVKQLGYIQFAVEIEGKTILSVDPKWPVLGSASVPFSPLATNIVVQSSAAPGLQPAVITRGPELAATVTVCLTNPKLLYAAQDARTRWFMLLILASSAAAFVGFVSAYRGFHQQLRLSEMKSNFVSSVSHELRAPIASMRLLAESLERGKITDETKKKEYFGFLVQESRRLSSLIENILDFSRIEQGRKKYQFEPTDLDFLVEQTFKLMQPCALERGVELKLQKTDPDDAPIVQGDGLAIQQALINLIDNAVKHSSQGGVVTIGLERETDSFRLWVEDGGPGIPPEEHEKIFERFYRRGSELRRETQGIGIGLSLVKHTVEAHGGSVDLRSEIGQGSRFTIELPNQPDAVKYK